MKREKGLTLIELLITISILFIISSVVYGVFAGINNKFRLLSGNSNKEQEANIIMTTIKNYHLRNSSYVISYDAINKVYMIGISSPNQQLGSKNLKLLTINGVNIQNVPNKIMPIDTTTTKSINVHIDLGSPYTFDTVINKF